MPKNQNEDDYFEFSSGNIITERTTSISMAFMQLVLFFSSCIIRWEQGIPTGSFSLNVEKFQVIFTHVSHTETKELKF